MDYQSTGRRDARTGSQYPEKESVTVFMHVGGRAGGDGPAGSRAHSSDTPAPSKELGRVHSPQQDFLLSKTPNSIRASNVTKPHFPALLKAGCDHVFHVLANETWAEVCEPSRKTALGEPLTWSFSFLFFSPFPPFCVFPRSRKMMAGALAAMSDQT